MKIAIGLFGIYYKDKYKLRKSKVDYRASYENYMENIIMPAYTFGLTRDENGCILDEIKINDVDFFLSTYHADEENDAQVLKDFAPKKWIFDDIEDYPNRFIGKNTRVAKLCTIIDEYQKEKDFEYDLIIMTRFDLLFLKNLNELNINRNKLNITCVIKGGYMDDNFYALPPKLLDRFRTVFIKRRHTVGHRHLGFLRKLGINRIFKGIYRNSLRTPLFKIKRNHGAYKEAIKADEEEKNIDSI